MKFKVSKMMEEGPNRLVLKHCDLDSKVKAMWSEDKSIEQFRKPKDEFYSATKVAGVVDDIDAEFITALVSLLGNKPPTSRRKIKVKT